MTEAELLAVLVTLLERPSAVRTEAASVEYRSAADLAELVALIRSLKASPRLTAIPVVILDDQEA